MKLTFREIEVFRAVMTAGTVTGAARLIGVSQPAVSRMLGRWQDRLGLPLFRRARGRLYPTADARVLAGEAERVFQAFGAAEAALGRLVAGDGSVVRVVASPSLGLAVVPRAMALAQQRLKRARFALEIAPQAQLVEHVVSHRADLGVTLFAVEHPNIESHKIGAGRLVCVVPRGHRLATRRFVTKADLAGERFVGFPADAPQGRLIAGLFAGGAAGPEIVAEARFGQIACALVNQGVGVALVDEFSAAFGTFAHVVRRPFRARVAFGVHVVGDPLRPPSRAATALVDALGRVLAGRA
jgi:DNA-binding transcriptional LysR family regulator